LVGQHAPPFRLQDQDDRWVGLDEVLASGPIVLAFYPADFSFVCTRQLCDYRDAYADIRAAGVRIVGISPDSPARHREFIDQRRLEFQLLSDPTKSAFRAYGVFSRWLPLKHRAIFLIGRDARVRYQRIEPTVFTHRGATDVLAMVRDVGGQL
jgi:thioredoxin-dependent peroxiredoxin